MIGSVRNLSGYIGRARSHRPRSLPRPRSDPEAEPRPKRTARWGGPQKVKM